MNGERTTVSILQACRQVNVSRRTIYNWMARGKVEYVRTAGGAVRIFSDTLWRSSDGLPAPLRTPAPTDGENEKASTLERS
ncbi:MAG: excisionase family DNA-binding protein [Vicinamibacterales bacterium]